MFALWILFLAFCSYTVSATTGTVVVSSGNTLKVHTSPSTSSSTIYSLNNGAVVTLTCYTKGDSVSGSQGTTDQWDKIDSSTYGPGYVSHAYISSSGSIPSCTETGCSGTVVVSSGATLKVHSSPSTASSTLYSLANGAVAGLTCVTTGDSVSGSQGTTDAWYQISSAGYASAAYMSAPCTPTTCSISNSTFQMALNYGMANIGTIYVGCAGGNYRFGVVAPYDMYHDGTTCGQSRVYFQPKGSVGFDCSGLMVQMFDAAGIYLPYQSSSAIKDNVPEVSKSSIRQGDMLAKDGHVVMWIGNSQVIESTPYTQKSDTSWTGTRVNSDSSFMNSAEYTAHRYPGLY
mmetsp:Transcript_113622/g.222820  ORF Transcript_113622/g.222820 Transcript_113622/m.222820 type:complete len:345 (-) Transcript_113622:54-1088(-)|eukprot:CAMPEP_0170364848 /NCGR_PEP_ID=MMETSP0117_2-20130122/5595_1 /TAXON_ID=400756 /ORGANISM="Durinskia baltica, Strain CSIRO CS-38" /LENGTH=344 /DNA_ID=CAMNT_0010619381 /DNA_START=48 /DNA_END=1082 /DNA_ORIENTATION=+